ncbi:MAG: GNAT family N-acetyltransferase [Actinomycetota bacterium]|nr:GNAT family N-acetyltransferase [Actinomycetota bacterium]
MTETITYLELTDPADLREPASPARVEHRFREVTDPKINRSLYEEIGGPHQWLDRLRWSDDQWAAWAAGVETWMAEVDGEPAGYLELRVDRESTLISIFGVRQPYRGQGLGAALLTHGIKRGFELAPRVWVSTNTMDAEHALANYEARGMRAFRREPLA